MLLSLLSFGVFILLCYITIKRQQRDIDVNQNPIYNICENESLKMNENAAYDGVVIESEMCRNIAYEMTVNMSQNMAYESTRTEAENHMYETVNV